MFVTTEAAGSDRHSWQSRFQVTAGNPAGQVNDKAEALDFQPGQGGANKRAQTAYARIFSSASGHATALDRAAQQW